MVKCDICQKKMPERVLEAHKKKRHSKQEVIPSEIVNEVIPTETKDCDCLCKKMIICGTCQRQVSELVMPYHLHVIHGL